MALDLSIKADALLNQVSIDSQIILDIDGISKIFGARAIFQEIEYGEDITYGDGSNYGGSIEDPDSLSYISVRGATTKSIKQQIQPEKGGTSSIQNVTIELIDKNQEVSRLFQPGNEVADILGRDARVYLNFGGEHPADSSSIFNGIVTSLSYAAGSIILVISNPEELKRAEIFETATTKLDGSINSSITTLTVDATTNFILPADDITSFVRIDDEIIQFTGVTSTTFTGCTRGALGTTAATHDDNAEAVSFYRLQGDPIDTALKLMLSTTDNDGFGDGEDVLNFVQTSIGTDVDNAVTFDFDIVDKYGLVVGDFISTTGATNGANDFTDRTIIDIEIIDIGSYVVVDGAALIKEVTSPATCSFKSKYDVLPDGANMRPIQVDVAQHERLDLLFGGGFPSYDFYIRDTIKASDFINEQVYFPVGLYSMPRKGKVSCSFTSPPLVESETPVIDIDNVVNPDKLKIKRTTAKNFFNSIVYQYEEQNIEDDRFLTSLITLSVSSTTRIPTRNKPLTIQAKGLRDNAVTTNALKTQSRRFTDRYKYAAEEIDVEVFYKIGAKVEPGDPVIFGDTSLQVVDQAEGTRNFAPRVFEVINKNINLFTGKTTLKLLDTKFGLSTRVGVVGPGSKVDSGASTTEIPVKISYSTDPLVDKEADKWERYIGQEILVRSDDYTTSGHTVLTGFSATQENLMQVSPALGFTPAEDYIVEMPNYGTGNSDERALWKEVHVYTCPNVDVTSGTSTTVFDVSAGDAARFFVGSVVRVHNADFSDDSTTDINEDDAVVTDVTSTTIEVNRSLGFTPNTSHSVDLIGFDGDEGGPYIYF